MAAPPVEALSLPGLFGRIDEIERLKESKARAGEEEQATIASEGAVKKAIAIQLDAAAESGLSNAEKAVAKTFLEAQLKAVDPYDKHAAARREKLNQLLVGVGQAPGKEVPAHVKRGKDALKRAQDAFKDVHERYSKWEKGKLMFKTTDELKAMQKEHEDMMKCLEATEAFIELMKLLRSSDARPPPLPSGQTVARPKAKSAAVRCEDPTVRGPAVASRGPAVASRGAGGYPSVSSMQSSGYMVGNATLRKAELIADLRAEATNKAEYSMAPPEPPRAPKPRHVTECREEDTVVLSYACTCKAVAEICGISLDKARDMAESSKEFRNHLNNAQWTQVRDRSQAIEKEQKEKEKEKEQDKKDRALAKISNKQAPLASGAGASASAAPIQRRAPPAAKPAAVKAKPAPKPVGKGKAMGVATAKNPFAAMADSDSDDGGGWSKAGR